MRNRLQLSCVECRRKKKKCNKLEPCDRCYKSNKLCVYAKNTEKSLKLGNQSEYVYREDDNTYYMFNKCKRVEAKWFTLIYRLERMVDFCHLDPKLSFIKTILDSNQLENVVGKKLKRNELNMIKKVSLENYGVDPEIHNLIEYLIGMCFQFCYLNPVTIQTIRRSYMNYGLNSYLVNCIAALMLPKYILLRGSLNPLPLNENVFYIKALYLLSCASTSKTEIALGTIYLFCYESSFGNSFGAIIHLGMGKSACLELRINMVDADRQVSYNTEQNIEICEKRNVWWCIFVIEVIMSLLYNFPIPKKPNVENCHMPHHLLNFSPGPYSIIENIDNDFQSLYSPSIYQKLPHFNHLSILTWQIGAIVFFVDKFKKFYNCSKNINARVKLLNEIECYFEVIFLKYSRLFDLVDYQTNLKTNPSDYATTSALFIVLNYNIFILFFYEAISMCYVDVKLLITAERYKQCLRTKAKSIFSFVIKTMKLKNYPDPEIDLTQYYISCQIIPDLFVSIVKLFIPINSTEDSNQAQFILELLAEFSLYFPMAKLHFEWCKSQIKTNGRLYYTNKNNEPYPQRAMLKILDKSLNKQFFC